MFQSRAQTWVNTVNTVGVMGKGVALEFRKRFPEMYQDYVERCRLHRVRLGEPYLFKRPSSPWILNFPTKDHWRSPSSLEAIVSGLDYLEAHYSEWGITSLAVPPLGSGLGRLEWRVVGPTLYRHLQRLPIPVELYAPFGTPHEELQPEYLEHTLIDMAEVNNGLIKEDQLGQMFAIRPGRTFDDARTLYGRQLAEWESAIGEVADLFLRIRTTRQAEIAATVHFVAKQLSQQLGRRLRTRVDPPTTRSSRLLQSTTPGQETLALTFWVYSRGGSTSTSPSPIQNLLLHTSKKQLTKGDSAQPNESVSIGAG